MLPKKHLKKNRTLKIGQNIRKWRELKGVKQEQLALKLNITKGALSNIENEKTDVNLSRIEEIAKHLGLESRLLFKNPLDLILPPPQRINHNLHIYKAT